MATSGTQKRTQKPLPKSLSKTSKSHAKQASKGQAKAHKDTKAVKSKLAFIKEAFLGKKKAEKKPAAKVASKTPAKPAKAAVLTKTKEASAKKLAASVTAAGKKGAPAPAPAPLLKATKLPKEKVLRAKAAKGASGLSAHSLEAGETVCREVACEGLATTAGYCRLHYIKNWKKIKRKELILKEKKLNQYIEELVAKYPDKYIEAIRQDLASDKDFAKVIYDLDLDETMDDFDMDGESMDSLIDTIKRDFEDEGEGF